MVLYTDTLTGPTHGGEGGKGGYLSIFGKHFGSTPSVLIGGHEVASVEYVGPSKISDKLGIEQITVQVGALDGAPAGQPMPVSVVAHGSKSSDTSTTFTPTKGKVIFVALNGDDGRAVVNDVTKPYRHLQDQANGTGAYYAMGPGDQVVVRGGEWSDAQGWDGTWMRAGGSYNSNADARNGTPDAWIHVTAYPGEDVHYTTPAGKSGGIAGPWSAIAGTSGEYWAVSNLRMDVNAAAAPDAAPINGQYSAGHWRVVNNELGPWPVAGVEDAKAGGIAGRGDDFQVLGNHIHDIGGTSALENHGVYADTTSSHWRIAHNWIHDISGGSLLQFNDSKGGAGTAELPHGGIWPGYNGIKVDHNWLENAAKFGLTIADPGAQAGTVEMQVWNNVILGTALPPVRTSSTATSFDVLFAYNTIANSNLTYSGSGNTYFRNEANGSGSIRVYNNLLALSPETAADKNYAWFADTGEGRGTGWEFKSNLYWDAGRGLNLPSGDNSGVSVDPLLDDDMRPHAGAAGMAKAGQLPSDDLFSEPRVAPDIGAVLWKR